MTDAQLIEQCEWWCAEGGYRLNAGILMVPDHYNYEKPDIVRELLKRFKDIGTE